MKYYSLVTSVFRFFALLCTALWLSQPPAQAAAVKPSIYAFNTFGPTTINLGETATLNWSVGDATSLSISPGVGNVTGLTQIDVTPTATTTYTLTATNAAGSVTKTRKLTVIVPPVLQSFTASPASVISGGTSTLNWSAPGATSFTVSSDVGDAPGTQFGNSATVKPWVTTTYTIVARNTAGSDTRTLTLNVTPAGPKPSIVTFTAAPTSLVAGQSTTLAWTTTGATSLSISPLVGTVPGPNGTISIAPLATTTYKLTATNANGSTTKNVTVNVTPAPPVIAEFTATPTTILAGNSTTLGWSLTGATSLLISPSVGSVTGSSVSVSPTTTTTYTLSAMNSGGTVTKTVTVAVTQPVPPPVIGAFFASPSTITLGGSSTLNWSVTGATSLSVSANLGASPGAVTGNSVAVSPTGTTVYTLTAANAGGTLTQSITVEVITPVPLPVIASFTASPATISSGSSTLSWNVTGATSLSILANVGSNPGTVTGTSFAVSPQATTTYTLSATNASGTVTKTVTVTVVAPPPGISIDSLIATPDNVNPGDAVTLSWVVTGTDSLWMSADNGGDPGAMNGRTSVVVHPTVTTRYALTAFSSQYGTIAKSIIVTVGPPPLPTIDAFTATPATIAIGGSTTLEWATSNAMSVSISADLGASPGAVTGASVAVTPLANTVYTITATNAFGSTTRTVAVTVTGPTAPVIGSFIATPAFIPAGGSSTLSWSISGANTVSISADVGANPGVVTGNSVVVTPSATTTYTLTATNEIGARVALAPVTIYTPGNGAVEHPRIWITPATLPALRQRAANNDAAWLKLRADCDAWATMPVAFPDQSPSSGTINGGYQYMDYLQPATALGLGYQIAKTVDPVRAARYATKEKQILLALSDPIHHGIPNIDSGYSVRAYVPALALGYDWIFDTLSDSDRAQIYTEINRWIASYESVGFGRSFPNGNYFAGYYCAKPLGALATEGENPQAVAMWNDWLNRVHLGMVQPYYAQWLSGGGAPDGWNYGPFETINLVRPLAAAFTAKGLDLIHHTTKPFAFPDGTARWITHFAWPDLKTVNDRGLLYDGDNPAPTSPAWSTQYAGLLRLANGDNAPIAQQFNQDLRALSNERGESWAEFLFQDNNAPRADYRTALSLRTPGDGQVAMRSSWASDAVWGAFQAGPYTGYQESAEEYYDKGSLVIQRGGVQFVVNATGALIRNSPGTNDGETGNLWNLVYNEVFDTQTDGVYHGRRLFNTYFAVRAGGYWGQVNPGPGETTTTLSKFEERGSYVLMRGANLEDMYISNHPITGWNRSVVYVRPQLFVVHDRTSVNNASVDNWMAWHVAAKPVEQIGAAPGTHRFDVVDTRAAFGGNLFRGRVTTVLPVNHNVTTVDTFGRGKVYRLEIRPGAAVNAASWLTVFDASASAAGASSAAPLSAGLLEGTLITKPTGGNVAVLFSQNGQTVQGGGSLNLPAADTFVVIADLAPNAGYAVNAVVAGGNLTLGVTPGGSFTTTPEGTLAVNVSATGSVVAQ